MRIVFALIEVALALYLLVLLGPSFLGAPVPSPLSLLEHLVPNVSFAGGVVYGVMSYIGRAIVLLFVIACLVGLVRVGGKRLQR